MIKIVSGSSQPSGSTLALVSLCNQFNSRGFPCMLFGPDNWHLDKCSSGTLDEFRPEQGDTVIVNDLRLFSVSDIYNLDGLVEESRLNLLSRRVVSLFTSLSPFSRPHEIRFFLTCLGDDPCRGNLSRPSLFQKIHYLSDAHQYCANMQRRTFVCPNFVENLEIYTSKPRNVAAVIGSIREENRIDISLRKAFSEGMETVIIYGYLADPIYYYDRIVPLTEKYPGRIKFAGFMDDKQKMYDSVSDVYSSVRKPWGMVRRECTLTGTVFHGPDEQSTCSYMTNNQIFEVWKSELGI